tara:strand:+ start:8971 stop:9606 length:636 start_codon:yes stop_codon:yes gene_type:complete
MYNIDMSVLIIAPHADDELLGVGGTAYKYLDNGNEVHVIICGVRKNDDSDQIKNATKDFTSIHILPFEDESYNIIKNKLLKNLENIYNNLKPNIVFIPNKDDFNMDHKTVHEICEVVLRRYQKHSPDKILMYEVPSSTNQSFNNNFKCNYYEQLSLTNLNSKIKRFHEYKNEVREFPNPRSLDGIKTYAMFRGMECNTAYAEGFNLIYQKS